MTIVSTRRPQSKLSHITSPDAMIPMTEAEYFEREKTANERSEYRYGRVIPMAGGTENVTSLETVSEL